MTAKQTIDNAAEELRKAAEMAQRARTNGAVSMEITFEDGKPNEPRLRTEREIKTT